MMDFSGTTFCASNIQANIALFKTATDQLKPLTLLNTDGSIFGLLLPQWAKSNHEADPTISWNFTPNTNFSRSANNNHSSSYQPRKTRLRATIQKVQDTTQKSTVAAESEIFISRLNSIFPHDIKARLFESPGVCVSNTQKGGRCTRQLNKKRIGNHRDFASMAKQACDAGGESVLKFAESITATAFCGTTHRRNLEATLAELCCSEKMSEDDWQKMSEWLRKLAEGVSTSTPSQSNVQQPGHRPVTRSMTVKSKAEFCNLRTKLQPYAPKSTAGISPADSIRKTVLQPLLPKSEIKNGWIYVYWIPGNFGLVKIGKSTVDDETRLKQWQDSCGHVIENATSKAFQVKHVGRVEKLIHMELKDQRMQLKEKCESQKCQRRHQEWFNVTIEHVKKVLEKYEKFAEMAPYEQRGTGENVPWTLKPSMSKKIDDLCRPIAVEAKTVKVRESRNRFR